MQRPFSIQTTNQITLYSVVFGSVWVKWLAWCLFIFFLLHPATPVFAMAEAEVPEEEVEEQVIGSVPTEPEVEEGIPPEEEIVIEEIVQTNESESVTESPEVISETSSVADEDTPEVDTSMSTEADDSGAEASATDTEEDVDVTNNDTEDQSVVPEAEITNEESASTSTVTASSTSAETGQATTSPPADIVDDEGTSDADQNDTTPQESDSNDSDTADEVDVDPIDDPPDEILHTDEVEDNTSSSTEHATTTTQTATTSSMYVVEHKPESDYEFSKDDCRVVGDSFYCTNPDKTDVQEEDALFAAVDKQGDKEIYLRVDGILTQLTDNKYDDAAPYYDAYSDTIVWHSLRNDRYQIVRYDLAKQKETVLTNSSYNNMQPMAYGDLVFWQAWIEDNWEIVRLEDGDIIQMTDNNVHDIAPYAQDDHVMWQTQNGEEWKITLYNLRTSKQQYLSADGDGYVKNPRLVLMYESHDPNGDMRLLGYDFKRKQHIALNSLPTSVPPTLPEPEEDTEERALVQSKPTLREESGEDDEDDTILPGIDLTTGSTSHATSGSDVIVTPFVPAEPDEGSDLAAAEAALDVLIEEAKENSTSSETELRSNRDEIRDVVIPPNRASSTRE